MATLKKKPTLEAINTNHKNKTIYKLRNLIIQKVGSTTIMIMQKKLKLRFR